MSKSNYDLTRQQHEDLLAAYREVCGSCWTQQEAWEKTAKHAAPRYYITPKAAYNKLSRMVQGDTSEIDSLSDNRRRLYYSLFEKLKDLSQRKDLIGKSLWFLCPILVMQPAPEFFIKSKTVKDIFIKNRLYGSRSRNKSND